MTAEEKLLLIDLCARLSSELKVKTSKGDGVLCGIDLIPDGAYLGISINGAVQDYFEFRDIKPYLRPMESMTEKEDKEFAMLQTDFYTDSFMYHIPASNMIDWLNSHHFDFRGLIPWGLALEAPANMYK